MFNIKYAYWSWLILINSDVYVPTKKSLRKSSVTKPCGPCRNNSREKITYFHLTNKHMILRGFSKVQRWVFSEIHSGFGDATAAIVVVVVFVEHYLPIDLRRLIFLLSPGPIKRLFDRTPRRMLIRAIRIVFLRDLNSSWSVEAISCCCPLRVPIDPSLHSNGMRWWKRRHSAGIN